MGLTFFCLMYKSVITCEKIKISARNIMNIETFNMTAIAANNSCDLAIRNAMEKSADMAVWDATDSGTRNMVAELIVNVAWDEIYSATNRATVVEISRASADATWNIPNE